MKIAIFAVGLIVLSGVGLAGCTNTVDGVGRDLERAGQSVQKAF
jgi:predicted small secreted protein